MFLSVVLPFSSWFWLLAFCFGCFCAEEKTSADSRLGFLLSMREMKMRLMSNFVDIDFAIKLNDKKSRRFDLSEAIFKCE